MFSQSAGSQLAGSAGSGGRFRVVTRQRARWGSRPGEAKHVLIKVYLKVFKKCLEHVRRWDDAVYLSATRNLCWRLTIRWFSVRYDARNSHWSVEGKLRRRGLEYSTVAAGLRYITLRSSITICTRELKDAFWSEHRFTESTFNLRHEQTYSKVYSRGQHMSTM